MGTKESVKTNAVASDHTGEYTYEGTNIVETDKTAHDTIISTGGTFVLSNHEGHFHSARILANE